MSASTTTSPTRPPWRAALRIGRAMMNDLHGNLSTLAAEYGPVAEIGWGPMRYVYVFGPEANEAVLSTHAASLTWHDALAPLIPVDGETALVVSDGDDHARRKRIVLPAFHRRRIDSYMVTMSQEAERTVSGWAPGSDVVAHETLRGTIRRITMRVLFGDEFAAQADTVGDELEAALQYVNRPPWRRSDHGWFPPYRAAMRCRRSVDELVFAEIERRRSAVANGEAPRDDVLSWLIEAHDDGGALTDVEVRDQVVSLVAAGYDTTAAAAAWLLDALLRNHDARRQLEAEIADVVPAGAPTAEHLQRMPWLDGCVSEALRLWPPGVVSGRRVESDIDVLGRRVPAGRMLLYSAWVTHRDPAVWPEPMAFRPGRWIASHPDHHSHVPYAFVTFGGGARRCLGFAMAVTELKVLAIHLLRDVRLEAAGPVPSPTGVATTSPSTGVPVRVLA